MNTRQMNYGLGLLLILFLTACAGAGTSVPVSLTWYDGEYDVQTRCYDNTFVIKNISGKEIGREWTIYYSQLPRDIHSIASGEIGIELIHANYFRIFPTEDYIPLRPGDSLVVRYQVTNPTPNVSQQPEGCYWVSATAGREHKPVAIDLCVRQRPDAEKLSAAHLSRLYAGNEALCAGSVIWEQSEIIPTVKHRTEREGALTVPAQVSLLYSNELSREAHILQEKLARLYRIEVSEVAPVSIRLNLLSDTSVHEEWYSLRVDTDQIVIEGVTPHGVFNGTQTLLSLLKGRQRPDELKCISITDYPDLDYRGFMVDIARNFTSVSDLKRLIDVMASYKMNVLHFHFADDEGWRLQIPGLEELTEVGARRGHTLDESAHLYPGYDGGYDPDAPTSGNGYYSREEFIDLLRYAAARHVRVIPEIESPGHARAAIVSMKAWYNRYKGKDDQKAYEYLLSDAEDTSVYVSAQSYTDNVMCVALPSVYAFMEKVIREIQAMYAEAGVELSALHIGGDEVPAGAWEGSPLCKQLMREKGMTDTHELFEYFYTQVTALLREKGIPFQGWQEVALNNRPDTEAQLLRNAAGIHCWNTVAEWGEDDIPYRLADKGYPVILCNVNNFYMDLAYSPHYDEPGHSWGGYVDERKAFSMLPFSVYRSSRVNIAGDPLDLDSVERGKVPLKPENRPLIRGVQAQLFAETIRDFTMVQYYYFPKILGLAERGWHAHPAWEALRGKQEEEAFNRDLSRFYALISDREMPYLHSIGIHFRLPHPGLMTDGEFLYANTSVRGAQIHYTTDGTEPTTASPVWTKPVPFSGGTVKACVCYLDKKSLTSTLTTQNQPL